VRASAWSIAAALATAACATGALAQSGGEPTACISAYDLGGLGLKDYQDPMLSVAVATLRRADLARDVAAAMDKADSADDAVRLARKQADDQEALVAASIEEANTAYAGLRLKASDLPGQPASAKCSGAHGKAVCSAMIARWEAQRLRQLATATPCYWDPSLPATSTASRPPAPTAPAPALAAVPALAPTPAARSSKPAQAAAPPPARAASDDDTQLNSSVIQASQAIDARNSAQASSYAAARAEYEAELARQKAEAEDAKRKHAEEMAAWKAQVEACKAGDFNRCK